MQVIQQQRAYLAAQWLLHVVRAHGFVIPVNVPKLHRHVIPAEHVAPTAAKLDVGDGGNDLREERALCCSDVCIDDVQLARH